MHCKYADNTKLGEAVDSLEVRDSLQRGLDRLESWAITKHMKFNKNKWPFQHLGESNSRCAYRWGKKRLELSSSDRDLGDLVDDKLHMSQ